MEESICSEMYIYLFQLNTQLYMDGINGWIRPNAYEEKEESPT